MKRRRWGAEDEQTDGETLQTMDPNTEGRTDRAAEERREIKQCSKRTEVFNTERWMNRGMMGWSAGRMERRKDRATGVKEDVVGKVR